MGVTFQPLVRTLLSTFDGPRFKVLYTLSIEGPMSKSALTKKLKRVSAGDLEEHLAELEGKKLIRRNGDWSITF